VTLQLVAAGDVDDVTPADRAALVASVVSLADVPPAAVASRLEAASVRYTFHICVIGTAAAEATRARLDALFPSASKASTELGVSAESVPVISIIDGAPHCSLKADGYHALQLLPPAPTAAPTEELSNAVTVGNDPMMKVHGGNFVKFSLTPGVLSPLLSWTSGEATKEVVKLELFGMTFSAGSVDTTAPTPAPAATGEDRSTRLLKRGPPQDAQCQHGITRRLDSAEQLAAGGAGSGSLACCPAACGQCGGGGCERKPGGSLQCCVYGLVASNQFCQNETSVACIVSAAASQDRPSPKDSRQRQQQEAEFMSIAKKADEAQRAAEQASQTEGAEQKVSNVLFPQVSSLAADEAASTMAMALAFLAPGKEDAQWFGQLTLKANGVPVLNVSRGEGGFGEMVVEIDGKGVARGWKSPEHDIDQSFSSKLGMRSTLKFGKKHVGGTHGQALVVEAPGFKFSVESRPASKFPMPTDQIRYGHLNLKFDEDALPRFSKGFLAQLAGVREMTERRRSSYSVTNSLPARPSATALAEFESDALWVRRSLEDLF